MQSVEHLVRHSPQQPRSAEVSVALVVFAETAVVVHPAKGAFDNPALGQHLEALHSIAAFDDFNGKAELLLDSLLPRFPFKARISPHHF